MPLIFSNHIQGEPMSGANSTLEQQVLAGFYAGVETFFYKTAFMLLLELAFIAISSLYPASDKDIKDGSDREKQELAKLNDMGAMYIVLAGPIIEEIIFRGFVLSLLKSALSGSQLSEEMARRIAIEGSAILFGDIHNHPVQKLLSYQSGIRYAELAEKYDTLLPSIAAHVTNNFVGMIEIYVRSKLKSKNNDAIVEVNKPEPAQTLSAKLQKYRRKM